jgi:hypothetical protein
MPFLPFILRFLFLAVSLQGVAHAGPLDNCLEFLKYGVPGVQGDLEEQVQQLVESRVAPALW